MGSCDTMKKTFKFLEENGMDYAFYDYKKEMPTREFLESVLEKVSLDELVNKRGTTYRKLSETEKKELDQEATALPLLMENSSMIKRPLLIFSNGDILLGFQPDKIIEKLKVQD